LHLITTSKKLTKLDPTPRQKFFPSEIWKIIKGHNKCTNVKGDHTTEQRQFHDFSMNHFLTIASVTLLTDLPLQQGMVG
jgi:hypothetical protein